jgi:hypothetical protein
MVANLSSFREVNARTVPDSSLQDACLMPFVPVGLDGSKDLIFLVDMSGIVEHELRHAQLSVWVRRI